MTDENQNIAIGPGKNDADGLPQLDTVSEKKKKLPVLPVFFLLVIIAVVLGGAQWGITKLGFFNSKNVVVKEPPLPVISDSANEKKLNSGVKLPENTGNNSDYVRLSESLNTASIDDERISNENFNKGIDFSKIEDDLKALDSKLSQYNAKSDENSIQINAIRDDLQSLNNTLKSVMSVSAEIQRSVKENGRWLGGVSKQLEEIGINVANTKMEFPIVVYNSNIWGEDVYLTVAPVENPEQTFFLKEGGVVGKWKLSKITSHEAIFHHVNGEEKVLII
ncbi:hypothetical protein [Shewanella xiamenensis]|uniref:hypothetical protein n=1 Tax=Shewanella xiamenensis TaxID=332186 RepID=UPI0021BE489B|nr:hypothetical protein [Shewanella xiamenensis]MCT8873806.1 hypothetical protein [Shewanella xiamenensis]